MLVPQLWIFHRRPYSEFLFNIVLCKDIALDPSTTPVPGPPDQYILSSGGSFPPLPLWDVLGTVKGKASRKGEGGES